MERALALRDVMDHAVKVQKEYARPTAPPKSRGRAVAISVICIPLLAFSVYSWTARPEFIWGPKAGPVPAVQHEAGLRFSMFLLATRIEGFRRSQGRYPSTLAELGESVPGVTYAVVQDGRFELRAIEAGKPIVLRSSESMDAFLGNSTNTIQGIAPK